ncbi:PspC domain-containing protein [Pseudonocardia sp.]|jgi:phage shock protein PspC (stress-responsive transcriptional regulator)|uniref:PspC domain-containing protein n=1 Tax=Pseudonocardia sp. TaxID=60912 RepID=UPI00263002E6|nr:PspC domain-containing protein [Pseudonocardia sp.]MCW2717901.1 phage shock protein PspC [Pseudonocardia sp.]MDT7616127.1 phage shock protein [Pseudonocardiales bacterium]
MSENPNADTPSGLRRSRADQVLGGVCAGIAIRLGVDPILVRIAAVAAALVSGGVAVVAYLLAWIVLPQADDGPHGVLPPVGPGHARQAWTAAGGDLRSLATSLQGPPSEAERRERSRAAAIDAALTSLGDRLRDPEVREGARRAATGVSTAVGASVDELAARARSTR